MKEQADKILLDEVVKGNEDVWQQIVDIYSGRLYAFAVRQLGRRKSEAEDLVQDTFIAFAQNVHKIVSVRSLEAYLFTILRRRIIDFRRRKKAENLTETKWTANMLSPAETPSNAVSRAEEIQRSKKALSEAITEYINLLKDAGKYRTIAALELLFLFEYPGKSVAEELGLTPVQVSRAKQASLDYIREKVQDALSINHKSSTYIFQVNSKISLKDIWEDNLLTCLKRSTLGAYEFGILPEDLSEYVKFHLEKINCPYCHANIDDMKKESNKLPEFKERIFTTSTPFLRKKR